MEHLVRRGGGRGIDAFSTEDSRAGVTTKLSAGKPRSLMQVATQP